MSKKGIIDEIFSKALFADNPNLYKISFRNFHRIQESSLPQFLIQSDYFQTIPVNRIKKIKRGNTILFEKKLVRVDH